MDLNILQFPAHTRHTDLAESVWQAKKAEILTAIYANPIVSYDKAKGIVEDMVSGEKSRVEKAWGHIAKAARTVYDVRNGAENEVLERHKAVSSSVLPIMPRVVANFLNLGDETEIDMEWMKWYDTDVLTDTSAASIQDIKNLVEWHDLDTDTSDIPASDFMASTWVNIRPQYKGAKVRVSRDTMLTDPMTTVNMIVIAIRYKAEIKKSQFAYTNTQAAIAAANTAGYTTTFVAGNLPRTISNARNTLAVRNKDKGYQLANNTPMVLIANESLRAPIEAAFVQTNFIAFGTQQVLYPVDRVYTYNLAADLGIASTKAVLVWPGKKNRFGLFRPLRIENAINIENNSQVFVGREAYEATSEEEQFQIINLV